MHLVILVIEVLGEARGWHVFNFALEDFRDGVAHLLEDVQEEHQFVLTLLTVRHVFVELVDG